MVYKLELSKISYKQLKKIDSNQSKIILKWLDKNVNGSKNYKEVPSYKELSGSYKGCFRYRVGNYRIICQVRDSELIITAITIGHRKYIYK